MMGKDKIDRHNIQLNTVLNQARIGKLTPIAHLGDWRFSTEGGG